MVTRSKKNRRGRPIEYAGGTKSLSATIPTEVYDEFCRRMKDLGQKNLSRMVTDALRVWISSRSTLAPRQRRASSSCP